MRSTRQCTSRPSRSKSSRVSSTPTRPAMASRWTTALVEPPIASESFADAVRQTVEHASQTIRNIQSVWVKEFEGVVENNRVTQFQGVVKVSFLLEEGGAG